ncbi:inactive tyrosine-protein kinase 7a [Aplochiton taeniatus]
MLRCEVNQSEDIVYTWLQNSQLVTQSERRFQEGANLKFSVVDRRQDAGSFQCVAYSNATAREERSTNASFNIKWLESGAVTLMDPESQQDIQSSSPVSFRCNIDGHPRPTGHWFRDGVRLPEKTHQINNKERTLTVASVGPEHNGVYSCCAKNSAGHTCSDANVTLSIIDKSYPSAVVSPEDVLVVRNDKAMLHCLFTADPPPTQLWYHEDELIANKSRLVLMANGSLLITQVKPRNTGLYKCVAQGSSGPAVTLKATVRLAEMEDFGPGYSLVFPLDTMQRITCEPPRSYPGPQVWFETPSGQMVPDSGRVYQDGLALVFNPTAREDNGVFTCVVQNRAGTKRQEISLTLASPPEWVVQPENSQLQEGQPGYLHCLTNSNVPAQVTWYRNFNPITKEDARFKVFPNGTLRINSVEVYDNHLYVCHNQNDAGRLEGRAMVTVLERLKFTPVPQPAQCLEMGKESLVQCSAKGREKPSVNWTRADGKEMPSTVEQSGGTLHFTMVTRSDAGNYTCHASNALQGEITAAVQLTVAVYIVFKLEPEPTTVYQGHTAMLHCQATGDPAPFIQWKKKDRFLEPTWTRFQTMPNGSLVIHDVSMEDTGSYTCIAGNSCNIQHTSTQLHVVEPPVHHSMEEGEKAPYKMIQTVGLSVGAAVAYIIVVLGLMFYCKKRRNAKRASKDTEEEGPETQHLNGGQATAETQEEVALTSIAGSANNNTGTSTGTNTKRHSSHDRMLYPRTNLETITTLGKGEFGEVFLAKAKGLVVARGGKGGGEQEKEEEEEEEVVVLVKSLQSRDEGHQLEFRREAEMFGKLSHPNLTRLLAMCREAEPHYLILEYAQMGDLKQYLKMCKNKDKPKAHHLSSKQKVGVCLQVAKAMEHLSNQRFVHKDLATRNCLISNKRQVKVSSLGLSKDVYNSEYYHCRQAWVPVRWLPAEAVLDDDYSTKTDVWSFGVFMWEVFSLGELPHASLTHDQLLQELRSGGLRLPLPQGCPSRVYKLMCLCWAPSPKDRPCFTEALATLSELPNESKV